jgi:hypothetical protein
MLSEGEYNGFADGGDDNIPSDGELNKFTADDPIAMEELRISPAK